MFKYLPPNYTFTAIKSLLANAGLTENQYNFISMTKLPRKATKPGYCFVNFVNREAAQTAAYEPFQRLNVFGQGVTGLMGGMQSFGDVIKTQPSPSPLQSALGIGTSVAGILGALR